MAALPQATHHWYHQFSWIQWCDHTCITNLCRQLTCVTFSVTTQCRHSPPTTFDATTLVPSPKPSFPLWLRPSRVIMMVWNTHLYTLWVRTYEALSGWGSGKVLLDIIFKIKENYLIMISNTIEILFIVYSIMPHVRNFTLIYCPF